MSYIVPVRKTIRIKTREELGLALDERPKMWNHLGEMDYLFGKTVEAIIYADGEAEVDCVDSVHCSWLLKDNEYEIVKE